MFAWTEADRDRVRDLRNARSPDSADLAAEPVFCFEGACKVSAVLLLLSLLGSVCCEQVSLSKGFVQVMCIMAMSSWLSAAVVVQAFYWACVSYFYVRPPAPAHCAYMAAVDRQPACIHAPAAWLGPLRH